MILLISPYQNANDCAAQIQGATHEEVKTVDTIRTGLAALRVHEFTLVVADENLLECSLESAEALVQRMGSAIPVFLDMACMKPARITRFVQLAMQRRELQYKSAREAAVAELRSELKSELTGLLIGSELTMKMANLPPTVTEKLSLVLDSAKRIRAALEK
jgi:signal transduction histidine kinase